MQRRGIGEPQNVYCTAIELSYYPTEAAAIECRESGAKVRTQACELGVIYSTMAAGQCLDEADLSLVRGVAWNVRMPFRYDGYHTPPRIIHVGSLPVQLVSPPPQQG